MLLGIRNMQGGHEVNFTYLKASVAETNSQKYFTRSNTKVFL